MNAFFLYCNEKNLSDINKFKMEKKRNKGNDNY